MKLNIPNPFSTISPYNSADLARKTRLASSIFNVSISFAVPLTLLLGTMTFIIPSSGIYLVTTLVALTVPIAFLGRHLTRVGHPDQSIFAFLTILMFIVAVNSIVVEGFFPILVPGLIIIVFSAGVALGPKYSFGLAVIAAVFYVSVRAVSYAEVFETSKISGEFAFIVTTIVAIMAFIFGALLSQVLTKDLKLALKDATVELVKTNIKLKEASEMKSQFTARTSHELRTPLSAIIVFTDLALREAYGPLDERLRNGLEHVVSSARHLKGIINDILDLSKIEAGELEINVEPFRLEHCVLTIEAICEEAAAEKGIDYSVWVSPEMPAYIIGDESRITQILVNLTGNAVKFTEEGEVEVRVEPAGESAWQITVRDTGPGIPEKYFSTIFQAYRQLDTRTASSKISGTGLGLAITRNLIHLMDGEISVSSELGHGTTFKVVLPLIRMDVVEDEPAFLPEY